MASVAGSASPLSGYDVLLPEPASGDGDDMWQFLGLGADGDSSVPSSVGFFPSPASGSMASWAMVGHPPPSGSTHMEPSPPALSPLYLDADQHASFQLAPATATTAAPFELPPQQLQQHQTVPLFDISQVTSTANEGILGSGGTATVQDGSHPFLTAEDLLFGGQDMAELAPYMKTFSLDMPIASSMDQMGQQIPDFGMSGALQPTSPWNTTNLRMPDGLADHAFLMDDFISPSPSPNQRLSPQVLTPQQYTGQASPTASLPGAASPRSPAIKTESGSTSTDRKLTTPIAIRKVRPGGRVEKRKAPVSQLDSSSLGSSASSGSSSGSTKFLIVTPESVKSHADRPNPFECFEALRPTQRGRRGPLANETKENALQVRRLGACFCCHARKVKCDKERPCKNCKKLATTVPQVVCWQFQDFMTVLFPEFNRGHFKKDEMTLFISDNIENFKVDGADKPCTVELFSGARFATTLSVRAKFFTAKTSEVLQHWHVNVSGKAMDLQSRGSAPIGIETDTNSQRDELRKKAKEYIQNIIQEPSYSEQLTDAVRHTDLPQKILKIVQDYSRQCESPLVKRAMSIYALHYVMTRHLCLTRQSIVDLQSTGLIPQNVPWVTPRVLNRQVKAVMDELLIREMQVIFEGFSKSLKPKSRREWAPCLAAFLVLCLFMENLETAAETFVLAQTEIDLRGNSKPQYRVSVAETINREVENMPFKQFAYQFHQIYQTHSRDASTRAYNPLIDDLLIEPGELDSPAVQMVLALRQLIDGPNWSELDFLTADPVFSDSETDANPRNIAFKYTGRLIAKFLLSFTDERYIFGKE